MQIAPGVTIGGKYQVEKPLARGGMGAVWVARHIKLGSPVAIKFLDAHLAAAPALVARFEREARSAANLDTPHVVHVHDYGVEDGTPYLVMELLRGEDLNARLHQRRRLSLPEAASILTQMGRALRRAHEAGIVHRDLKPANVFMARVDENEVVKVLDFGIAKETWSRVDEATKTGEVFGSPHYMSPEQARAMKDVDHRADLWATGVMAYRMITGRLPFPGEVLGEVLSSVLVDPFPPIAEIAPELPARLEGFFERALAKRKEHRFSSIGELVDAFAAATAGASVVELAPVDAGHRQSLGSSAGSWASAPTPPAMVSPAVIADTTPAPAVPAAPLQARPPEVVVARHAPVPPPERTPQPVVARHAPVPPAPIQPNIPVPPVAAPEVFAARAPAPGLPAATSRAAETIPTQIYQPQVGGEAEARRVEGATAKLGPAPLEPPPAVERTGPSIASSTSSLSPPVPAARTSRVFLVIPAVIGVTVLVAAGAWLARGSGENTSGSAAAGSSSGAVMVPVQPASSATSEADASPSTTTLGTTSEAPQAPSGTTTLPETPRKTGEVAPAIPVGPTSARVPSPTSTATASAASDVWGVDVQPSGKTTGPEKPGTTATAKPTAAPTSKPAGTAVKKPEPDWGIDPKK